MGCAPLSSAPSHHPAGCRLLGLETDSTFSMPLWEPWRLSPGTPNDRRTAPACLPPGQPKNWASAPPSNASLAVSSSFFTRLWPPYSGWSAIVSQVALTYTATIIVALAAWQAHRPDLIRSPKRVLAHLWEDSEL